VPEVLSVCPITLVAAAATASAATVSTAVRLQRARTDLIVIATSGLLISDHRSWLGWIASPGVACRAASTAFRLDHHNRRINEVMITQLLHANNDYRPRPPSVGASAHDPAATQADRVVLKTDVA
jgi:hypothetical protein